MLTSLPPREPRLSLQQTGDRHPVSPALLPGQGRSGGKQPLWAGAGWDCPRGHLAPSAHRPHHTAQNHDEDTWCPGQHQSSWDPCPDRFLDFRLLKLGVRAGPQDPVCTPRAGDIKPSVPPALASDAPEAGCEGGLDTVSTAVPASLPGDQERSTETV